MNWTAVVVTFMICATAMVLSDKIKSIAKLWLEGLKTIRDTESIRHGFHPNGGTRK